MRTDPYTELLNVLQEAGGAGAPQGTLRPMLGMVLTVAPLTVDVAGTTQEAEHFYISHRLLKGHTEKLTLDCSDVSGALAISASCSFGSHSSMSVSSGTLSATANAEQAEPVLKEGDLVLLLTEDCQTFYLIDKVVHL